MAYQPFYIAGLKSGLIKSPESFLIPQDAFPELENAYIWRDRIKRKLGYSLLGRLTRVLVAESLGNSPSDPWFFNVFGILGLDTNEPSASIIPGTVIIISGANTYTEPFPPDGTLTGVPGGSGTINYSTGIISLLGMGVAAATTISFTYAPGLPVMGIGNRELISINLEELIVFDTVYAYRYNTVSNIFNEWIPGTIWTGGNANFFWTISYWQDTSQRDLFWATNFNTGTPPDPIRFSNGSTWTDFAPAVGSECISNEFLGTVVTPWNSFGPVSTANSPVIPKTVIITIEQTEPEPDIVLRDDGVLPVGALTTDTPGRADTGTINYATGSITLTVSPALTADAAVHIEYCFGEFFLQQALALIPYKDRLLAFHTFEGDTLATAVRFPQRLRYSQNGDPTDQLNGWRSDIPGRGGFIDAPTSEQIVSVAFIRDILIVSCERSTWQIRHTGDPILPFLWEKINTEYGSDSTFGTVQFDKGVLQIGRDALTVCNGNSVERIDGQIPDDIGEFVSTNDGNKRVHGFRDLNIQLVYWTYNDTPEYPPPIPFPAVRKVYPNKMLVYNYWNNSFSIWNDGFTTLGRWYKDNVLRWQDLEEAWQEWPHPWDWANRQQNFPETIAGNQQGFVEILNQTVTNDISLHITGISISFATGAVIISSPDHNLEEGQIVRLRNIIGGSGVEGLNDRLYKITNITALGIFFAGPPIISTFEILTFNEATQTFENVLITGPANYDGNGAIEVCNNFHIASKQFNIFESGSRSRLGHIDFLSDPTAVGEFTCQVFIDQNTSNAVNTGPLNIGDDPTGFFNSTVTTASDQFEVQGASKYWQRFYCPADGTTFQYKLSLSDVQMVTKDIYESTVTIHALIIWAIQGGRLIL
jgi:hypothetical protein